MSKTGDMVIELMENGKWVQFDSYNDDYQAQNDAYINEAA